MTDLHARRLIAALALTAGLGAAVAQTQAPKAAAKPPAKPAAAAAAPAAQPAKTVGGGSAGDNLPVLTREELRACFQRRDDLAGRLKDIEASRVALDKEREGLTQEQNALRAERENMAGMKTAVEGLNAKAKTFQQDVEEWNRAVADFNGSKASGPQMDSRRAELNRQGEALQKRQADLQAERTAVLAKGEEAVKGFNARAAGLDQRVTDWNERNRKLNGDAEALDKQRDTWTTECGNRRYREDDEKAILSGK